MKTIYTITSNVYGIDLSDIKVGDEYILVSRTNINTGDTEYKLIPDNGEGVGGNMDSSIKRYHGWRGTTGNWSSYAEGLRRIERIDWVRDDESSIDLRTMAKVKLSADLATDRP